MKQENLESHLIRGQGEKQIPTANLMQKEKEGKKRMTSYKNPNSQYKNTINRILSTQLSIEQNYEPNTELKVKKGWVFIGGTGTLSQQTLSKNQIGAVLSVLDSKKYQKESIEQKVEDSIQIQQHQFIDMTEDHFDILPYLNHSYHYINQVLSRGFNLLVHSNDGTSRAPAVVLHYVMKKYKLDFQKAYEFLKQKKPQINIKPVLMEQLKTLKF